MSLWSPDCYYNACRSMEKEVDRVWDEMRSAQEQLKFVIEHLSSDEPLVKEHLADCLEDLANCLEMKVTVNISDLRIQRSKNL
jgi:hypothetical protein